MIADVLRDAVAARSVGEARAIIARALHAKGGHKTVLLPTEFRTKELDMMPVWLRERAFFMAGVNRVEILQEFENRVRRIAKGELTVQEARKELRGELDRLGYEPEAGTEGTIKDLRTMRRMNVALETNLAQIHGYDRWMRQQEALKAFPAQKFVRLRLANVPRPDWPERFALAVAESGEAAGANVGEMAALVNHPCWVRLSRFGTPYAPFDFGSGMGLRPLSRTAAKDLGLMPGPEATAAHEQMMEPQDRGLNESLEASPAITGQEFRDELAEAMQGLGRWDGKRFIFTDPNGTRPYTAEALAELWSQPLPEAFAHLPGKGQMQCQSLIAWARDSDKYFNDPEAVIKTGGKDYWEDFARVLTRLLPSGREKQGMYRGLVFNSARELGDFLATMKREGYAIRPEFPAESWTGSLAAVKKYANQGGYQVILILPQGHSAARDIAPITRKFAREIARGVVPQGKLAITDDEILLPRRARLKVKAIRRAQETATGKIVEVVLEEAL